MDKAMNFQKTQIVTESLFDFSEKMGNAQTEIADGVLTARVVGEYSAGKTRVIREILANQIPQQYSPISSLEAQTRLQLEISYGQNNQLFLIEKSEDLDDAVIVEELTQFPSRAEVSQYNPDDYRLRLLINESRFILAKGDGYSDDNQPKKLFLIDTPGWNSGEDDLAEQDAHQYFDGEHNLAIIYVCHANRLDGEINKARLENFLEALGDAMFLTGKAHLHIIITHCQKDSQQRLSQRMRDRILQQWQDLYFEPENLMLNITALDFAEMSDQEIQKFRENFWQELLKPIGTEKFEFQQGYAEQILNWSNDWDIRPVLIKQIASLRKIQKILSFACLEGQFIQNMNMTRLRGLSSSEMIQRLTERWLKQIQVQNVDELKFLVQLQQLSEEHPLARWWNQYWLENLSIVYQAFWQYIQFMQQAIAQVSTEIIDLQDYLSTMIKPVYLQAVETISIAISFDLVTQVIEQQMQTLHLDKFIATLLKLSILESRYQDHYQHQIEYLG